MSGASTDVTRPIRLMPPQDHGTNDGDREDARVDRRETERRLHRVRHGVRLHAVTCQERSEAEHEREEDGHGLPLRAEAALDVVHRTARDRTLRATLHVHPAVRLRQRDFRELHRHPEQRRHPHPEQCARAAPVDGNGHTRNVADANRRRQRRGQRLEVRDITLHLRVVILARGDSESMTKPPDLDEAQPKSQEEPRPEQCYDDQRDRLATYRDAEAPHNVVQRTDNPRE
jgi:hypothetical protein